jgi:hypothetical protein
MSNLWYFDERLSCSYKEKTECLLTMRKLSHFLTVARADGFLALEPFEERETDPLIKACLSDILDVLDDKELKLRFEDYLLAGNYYGKDFLHAVIVLRGFLLLYTCQTPETFWKELQGYFGADFTRQYQEAFRQEQKNQGTTWSLRKAKTAE